MDKSAEQCKTAQDFHNFFSAIPEEKWLSGTYIATSGACCALGHCGERLDKDSARANALRKLFETNGLSVPFVNDRRDSRYQQPHPKLRILAALRDLINQPKSTNALV